MVDVKFCTAKRLRIIRFRIFIGGGSAFISCATVAEAEETMWFSEPLMQDPETGHHVAGPDLQLNSKTIIHGLELVVAAHKKEHYANKNASAVETNGKLKKAATNPRWPRKQRTLQLGIRALCHSCGSCPHCRVCFLFLASTLPSRTGDNTSIFVKGCAGNKAVFYTQN